MKPLNPLSVALRGAHLIEASAGTGKTFTITTLYLRLLLEAERPVANILVVTYTEAATAELRARIRGRLRAALHALAAGGDPDDTALDTLVRRRRAAGQSEHDRRVLLAALHGFDEAAIFTIHGFCQRALQEHAFESGVSFDAELIASQTPLLDEVVQDFWVRELCDAPPAFVRYLRTHLTPANLTALAGKVVGHPDMPVLPERVDVDLDAGLVAWQRAYAPAAAIWREARNEIERLLLESPGLSRVQYRPASIASKWVPRIDGVMAGECPGFSADFPEFAKFGTALLAEGTKKDCVTPQHAFFDACDTLLAAERRVCDQLAARLLRFQRAFVEYARTELQRRKDAAHVQFFDDLLQRLAQALDGPGGTALADKIRAQFGAALIDEFQDTDPVQYRIFHRLYRGTEAPLFLIGDPKQAIYAFRGADVFAYLAAKRDTAVGHTLLTNWRADRSLVEAVNTLYENADRQFFFEEIPFARVEPHAGATDALGGTVAGCAPLQILFVRRPDEDVIDKTWANDRLPDMIAAEIVRFLGSGATIDGTAVAPGDIAVLCRTNEQASKVQVALRTRRVPSVLQTQASVFASAEAAEMERVVRAIANPGDTGAVKAALATAVLGLNGDRLFALQEDERGWDAWIDRMRDWHETWAHGGFVVAFQRLIEECEVPRRLLELSDGERRLTNVLHLAELLHAAAIELHGGPLALAHWLAEMRADAAAGSDLAGDAAQIRLESDAAAVKLVTVHKAKGLEYPVVYCPFLWDGKLLHKADAEQPRFHDPTDRQRLKLDLGSPAREQHLELARREALAENLRLLYVAVTRAKHRCTIVWGAFNEAETSALGYLLHQPRSPESRRRSQSKVQGPKSKIADAEHPGVPELSDLGSTDAADLAEATARKIVSLVQQGDDALRGDLHALAAGTPRTITIGELSEPSDDSYEAATESTRPCECRTASRSLPLTWRTSSFSALTAVAPELSLPAEEGQDRDEGAAPRSDAAMPPASTPTLAVQLHDFPSGTRPGLLLHDIFERLDFQTADAAAIRQQISSTLGRFGFDLRWTEPLYAAIRDILDTPFDGGGAPLTLRQVPLGARLNELEFLFPVADRAPAIGAPRSPPVALTRERLAAVFASHARAPVPPGYAARVGALDFHPLAGYLRGFIDLVFTHAGRWYVIDYKSNSLGPSAGDYDPHQLLPIMDAHHYFLQYHLYIVALHRYLSARLPDYDYDRHFGGVYYLFLRGMSPAHAPGCGVFHDRPPRELVDALSAALAGDTSAPG
ncbi:MAG: exodeoxyribonuclease V subunit beta [Candidatus Binatia bacterium]